MSFVYFWPAILCFAFVIFSCAGPGTCKAPSLRSVFKANVEYKAWIDKDPISCTVAYCDRCHGLIHRLYLSCISEGVVQTKLFDFDSDTLYVLDGATGRWMVSHPIPDSEKNDRIFPVIFGMHEGRKMFEPNSLIRFLGENKQQVGIPSVRNEEWATDVDVTLQGRTHRCSNSIIWSRESHISPYCKGDTLKPNRCPLVPLTGRVSCTDMMFILYSFLNYTEEFDHRILEVPKKIDCKTKGEPLIKDNAGVSHQSSSAGIPYKPLSVAAAVLFSLVV